MKRYFATFVLSLAVTNAAIAQDDVLKIEVTGGDAGRVGAPLTIPLSLPKAWAEFDEVGVDFTFDGKAGATVGQLTAPGIMAESIKPSKDGLVRRDLHLVLRARTCQLVVHFKKPIPQVTRFAWTEKKDEYQTLVLARSDSVTPYLRYVNRPYDDSSAEARDKSYKVFHHLYDPDKGKRVVTNGGHTDDNIAKYVYPHHRGLMYAFHKCSYGPDLKQTADTWHCPAPSTDKKKNVPTAHVSHEKTLSTEAGPVLGRHRVLIGWYGAGEKPFAHEERELTVYNLPGGRLVEFASRLKGTDGKIRVDGDPQHSGFQFRAANDVGVKTAKQTYYLRPDGKGEPGETRNWDPKTKKGHIDLPWNALSFVLDEKRYTVCYLNHPSNPKESRFCERDYGRFGCDFVRDITPEEPLVVNYRLWLQAGEMTQAQAEELRESFASPPKCVVK